MNKYVNKSGDRLNEEILRMTQTQTAEIDKNK